MLKSYPVKVLEVHSRLARGAYTHLPADASRSSSSQMGIFAPRKCTLVFQDGKVEARVYLSTTVYDAKHKTVGCLIKVESNIGPIATSSTTGTSMPLTGPIAMALAAFCRTNLRGVCTDVHRHFVVCDKICECFEELARGAACAIDDGSTVRYVLHAIEARAPARARAATQ
jgi:hypothetical protein